MDRCTGTISRGIRAPIIRKGDNIVKIVVDSILNAMENDRFSLNDRDVIAVTEAVVARAQGNYATIGEIASDVAAKFNKEPFGVIFPILSRNRFAICLKGIAKGATKIYLMFSYPSDEVGNGLLTLDMLDEKGIDPWKDVLTEAQFHEIFGPSKHVFTGVDYIAYYKELIKSMGCEVEIILANDCRSILKFTKNVLACDIHSKERTKRLLKAAGANKVFGLDDILTSPINGSGFNDAYGLLGSNKATEESVKLFPRDCKNVVDSIQKEIKAQTGIHVEVMIYGDGAFKDPVGKIWELADPVVSPGYTDGLEGQPSEVKLKYIADNNFPDLEGVALQKAISEYIKNKHEHLTDKMVTQGTTPRRITDLIGSLCDLTSGSGDKGTPIVVVQGYFDNYTT
jgi:F420-0:gamma-glutamyl ligase